MRNTATKIRITAALVLTVVLLNQRVGGQSSPGVPTDAEIRSILAERIDKHRQSVGIVVGVIEPGGRRIVAHGKLAAGDSRTVDGDTVFEIGSITKVFTALLLTDMVGRGEVDFTDPVAKHLPSEVSVPKRNGEEITLRDLAMHFSSLPRMPSNVDSADPSNPFADYSIDRFYQFLSTYELPRDIGSGFEYSNIGGALLGHALARRTGMEYEALVEARIARPLGMQSTGVPLTPGMKTRLAAGHAYGLTRTPNWDLGAFEAAGALHSTANDLVTFLGANLGYTQTPLAQAMENMHRFRRSVGREQGEVAIAWFRQVHEGVEIVSHSGATGGYKSFIGYEPKTRVGVVVLSNAGTGAGIEDIGIHLLNPKVPLLEAEALQPQRERRQISLGPQVLGRFAGKYEFPSRQMASITIDGDHLLLQGEGEVKIAFYPETPRDFFATIMDAQISFEIDERGHVTGLLFHRSGSVQQVKRAR